MYRLLARLCKQMKKTADGKREYPRYLAIFPKDDGKNEIGFIDVKFAKDTLKAFDDLRGESSFIDVSVSVSESKDESADSFIAPIKRKDEKGKYVNVLDKNGNIIPHLVIQSLARKNLLAEPLNLPNRKRDNLSPSNVFGKKDESHKGIDPNDSSLPF